MARFSARSLTMYPQYSPTLDANSLQYCRDRNGEYHACSAFAFTVVEGATADMCGGFAYKRLKGVS